MKEPSYRRPMGTADILPDQMPYWRWVEETARAVFERYGYREIRTPLFEETRLFNRSIGEATDIVSKEMYQVTTSGSEEKELFSLRPEFTASVVRAYLENSLDKIQPFQKLYSLGPAFRHERPQKGRLRQFHQLNLEALGSRDPLLDAEVIQMTARLLEEMGLPQYEIRLNSLGCPKCRETYRTTLKTALAPRQAELCPDCQKRYTKNILRILDCKNQGCRTIIREMPAADYICADCRTHFTQVKSGLDKLGVRYRVDPTLVRGLDYYTRTVYEITYPTLGAQDALGGGGRYDNLIAEMGGPDLGAMGCALGMERIILALQTAGEDALRLASGVLRPLAAYLVTFDEACRRKGFALLAQLRGAKIAADMDFEGRSIKSQMRQATKLNAARVIIIGPDELARGEVKIKEMATGKETPVPLDSVVTYFQ